jgi:curved DNA-binding protein CbpA
MTGGTHYDTLGLPPDATAAEIREAYHRLTEARRAAGAGPKSEPREGEARTADLTRAYEVLADPRRRAEHDWRLGIDDLQPLDWGGALPEPHPVEAPPLRQGRRSLFGWLSVLRRLMT